MLIEANALPLSQTVSHCAAVRLLCLVQGSTPGPGGLSGMQVNEAHIQRLISRAGTEGPRVSC